MSKGKEHIIGINIQDRHKEAGLVQEILTRYGCSIRTRLGLHGVCNEECSSGGLLLLQLIPDDAEARLLIQALQKVPGVVVKEMEF
jgi:hypothetical protein